MCLLCSPRHRPLTGCNLGAVTAGGTVHRGIVYFAAELGTATISRIRKRATSSTPVGGHAGYALPNIAVGILAVKYVFFEV